MSLTAQQDAIEIAVSIRTALIYGYQINSTDCIDLIKALSKTHNLRVPDACELVANALTLLLSRDHMRKLDTELLVSQVKRQLLAAI